MVLDASLFNTQHYKVRINGKVERSRVRSNALPFISVSLLMKREPLGHPRLGSPALLTHFTSALSLLWIEWFFLCKFKKSFGLLSIIILVKVFSPDEDTDYFDIVEGVLQGDTLAPYLFIICLDYELRMSIDLMKENSFKLAKKRSKRYPAQTIADVDYADGIALLANSPAKAEALLHSLERAAGGIGLHVKENKTECMSFNQRGDISILKGGPLKLVGMFTYLRSSVSSTETDINTLQAKVWIAIDMLSVLWKSELTEKSKCSFFQAAVVSILLYGCMDAY